MPSHPPIAFAVPGDLSQPTGGYHYDRQLIAGLRAAGHEVTQIALPDGFPFPTDAQMEAAIAQLAAVPAETVLIVDGLAFGALSTRALARITAPVVALVHHPLAHESGLPRAESARLFALERENLRQAAHVLVPSGHIGGVLEAEFAVPGDKITVIRPGRPELAGTMPDVQAVATAPLILSVGILHPRKGHDVLTAALAQVADLPWRAVIVGSPWEAGHQDALQRQCDAAGLTDRVTLAGRVARDVLDALYAEAHLFALATRFEGYGIVFDEALMRGLPIVSTRAGAVPGTVPEAAGLLVAPDDADAFASALRAMLEDADLHRAKARAARAAGRALPSWADAAGQVSAIVGRIAREGLS